MPGRIAVSVLDGQWETLGTDRDPGNEPYGIAATYNDWGPDTLAFNIRRDPAVEHADLVAYTPVRYYPDAGDRATWAGFLLERPGGSEADPSIAGVARGWQYHLDDDVAPALFVHANMADWQDLRTHIDAYLPDWPSSATCNVSESQAVCGWPGGTVPITQNTGAGIFLDFGPDPNCWPLRLEVNVSYPDTAGLGPGPSTAVYLRCADSLAFLTGAGGGVLGTNSGEFVSGTSLSGNIGGTVTVARRYVGIFAWRAGATGTSPAAKDAQVAFRDVRAYRKAAYASAFASILKVSDIIKEVLPLAPLLDQSTADVASTSLSIPHAAWPREPRPPRQTIDEWNAYHRYVRKIGGPGLDRLVFKPQPSRAVLRVDTEQPGARFADASISSGADIYNRALVRAASGAGVPLEVVRMASGLAGAPQYPVPSAGQPVNPSASVNLTGVTPAGGTLTRDTTIFQSSPASFKYVTPSIGVWIIVWDFAPGFTFKANETYVFSVAARVTAGSDGWFFRRGFYPSDSPETFVNVAAGFTTYSFPWTPTIDYDSGDVDFQARAIAASTIYLDDLIVTQGRPTIIDRRGFRRAYTIDVGSPSDSVAMGALGDAALNLHAATPLKGSLEVSADDAVTELTTGRTVPMHELGLYAGELVHIANLSDPDVSGGTQGRNGKIAAVSGEGPVTLTIDNQRTAFEALLARMAVVRPRDPRR